ncbi:hypothetical protein RRG08_027857 [Elysia crispata]|uniref:Uncharacterized protein n=1 Tax=Elysia crispata TaxID=231223 RepID=A0AAE0YTC0_9GAST|nr:hypothetical protein RRG08_027857 [Elysia crispata]
MLLASSQKGKLKKISLLMGVRYLKNNILIGTSYIIYLLYVVGKEIKSAEIRRNRNYFLMEKTKTKTADTRIKSQSLKEICVISHVMGTRTKNQRKIWLRQRFASVTALIEIRDPILDGLEPRLEGSVMWICFGQSSPDSCSRKPRPGSPDPLDNVQRR